MDRRVAAATAIAFVLVVPAATSGASTSTAVEGHTRHVEIVNRPAQAVSVVGDVRCHVEIMEVTLTVPPSVGSAEARCSQDGEVIVHHAESPDPRGMDPSTTGRTFAVEGPQGAAHPVTEVAYGPDDAWTAWTAPVGETRTDPSTGRTYSFVAGVPAEAADGGPFRVRAWSGP